MAGIRKTDLEELPATDSLALLARSFADLLYPPVCFGCGCQIEGGLVCDRCRAELYAGRTGVCTKCGRPVTRGDQLTCGNCRPFSPERVRALGTYVAPYSGVVHALKYNGKSVLARLLGEALTRLVESDPSLASSEYVCPVPLHPARMRERGYNQSSLLASEVAKRTGIAFHDLLERVRNTRTQARMVSNSERMRNLRGAFRLKPETQLAGSRVLLVDDVVTSGATMDSAARRLLGAGASAVVGIAVAAA